MAVSPFKILGLTESSTPEMVEKAYVSLVSSYAPYKGATAEARALYIQINQAYRQIVSQGSRQIGGSSDFAVSAREDDFKCRRKRRGCRSHRRFGWQLPEEFVGTQIADKT